MPRKKSIRNRFNRLERLLQGVPTWVAITGIVIPLAIATVLLNVSFERDWSRRRIALKSFKAVFENLESIAIVSAVILYFKESPDRKDQKHYEAWQVIDTAASGRQPTSYARYKALEDLNNDDVSLAGLDVPGADLKEIDLKGADLSEADLSEANLYRADLRGADLKGVKLWGADLRGANLEGADLQGAELCGARFYIEQLDQIRRYGREITGILVLGEYTSRYEILDSDMLSSKQTKYLKERVF